jgi:hypothetical protein
MASATGGDTVTPVTTWLDEAGLAVEAGVVPGVEVSVEV